MQFGCFYFIQWPKTNYYDNLNISTDHAPTLTHLIHPSILIQRILHIKNLVQKLTARRSSLHLSPTTHHILRGCCSLCLNVGSAIVAYPNCVATAASRRAHVRAAFVAVWEHSSSSLLGFVLWAVPVGTRPVRC